MSFRSDDLVKPKKKSIKLRPKRTKKTKKSSTKCSEYVNPPSTVITSLDSAIIKWDQEKPRNCDPYEDGDYSKMPHETPNEVNFVGGIGGNVGHRRSKKFIDRTTKIQQIYNMRCDNKTVFNFCEDPLVTSNVPVKENVNHIQTDAFVKDTVCRIGGIKHEQLPKLKSPQPSMIVESDLEFDLNPNLANDQITDNKQTNLEIRRQFLDQQRSLLKQKLQKEVPDRLGDEYRKEKFKLSEYFDIDTIPEEGDVESQVQTKTDWTEKYKVEKHPCDLKFGRPMPQVIPMPLQTEKLAFLTRTLDKPKNVEKLNEELRKLSEPFERNVTKDFPYREAARELEKLLQKQKAENFSIELALKEFDEFMKNSEVFRITNEESTSVPVECRTDHLNASIKEFEEKILNQLDEPNVPCTVQDTFEKSELAEKNDERRTSFSSESITMPVDFTHAFDTRQNEARNGKKKIKAQDPKNNPNPSGETNENESTTGILPNNVKKNESFCTNFTNDSGSFIVTQGNKLHLDCLKTTEQVKQVKSQKTTTTFDEYLRPYEVLPLTEAKKLIRKDAKLVPTFDIKDRLRIDVPQFDTEQIGVKNRKHLSQLATEWDEYYQKEILNRPRIRRFKPRTIMKQIVDSLRLKYESIYKREYLTEKTIVIEQEKMFTKRAEKFRDFCVEFFSNLTTTNYRQSMAKIQDLRPIYELNDKLTQELTTLQNKLIQLKTAIIRTEGKVREATILQNVSYLMKEPTWREKNDWIHKRPDGSLETIKESIENRLTTNLRKRDNDDVWTIKEYFEKHVFNSKRPALICFESAEAILDTITNLKVQLYLSLLKLDLSTWTLMNLMYAHNSYIKWSTDFIEQRKKYVEARCAKKYFLDVCATNMKKDAKELFNGKLVETISEKTLRTLEPLCNTLFLNVIPQNIREQLEGSDSLSKFRIIISHAMNMLEQMDAIPSAKRQEIEKNIRKQNGFIQRRTIRAVELEQHIEKVRNVMIKHSKPPYRRQSRTGKLPRSYLQPSKPKPVKKVASVEESTETVRLAIKARDFEEFLTESPTQKDFYLDNQFFGGDPEVPNMDFLPEIKSNVNEFIVDIKNVLEKWERNKQESYLENAHNTWMNTFGVSGN